MTNEPTKCLRCGKEIKKNAIPQVCKKCDDLFSRIFDKVIKAAENKK